MVPIANKGEGIITNDAINAGHLISQSFIDPIVYTIDDGMSSSHCHFCLGVLNKKFSCSSCKFCRYCSPQCFKNDVPIHRLECLALQRLSNRMKVDISNYTRSIRLATRLIILCHNGGSDVREMMRSFVAWTPSEHIDVTNLRNLSVLIYRLISLIQDKIPNFSLDVDDIYHLLCQFRANNIGICHSDMNSVGVGLYPIVSKMNHSCQPNTAIFFEGIRAKTVSLRPLRQHEELTITYIELAQSTNSRRKLLKERYGFLCDCIRCKDTESDAPLTERLLDTYNESDEQQADSYFDRSSCSDSTIEETQCLKRAYDLYQRIYGPMHERLVNTCSKLCHNYIQNAEFDLALKFGRQLTPCFERYYPSLLPLLGVHYLMLAKLFSVLGQVEDRKQYATRAFDVLRYFFSKGDLEGVKQLL